MRLGPDAPPAPRGLWGVFTQSLRTTLRPAAGQKRVHTSKEKHAPPAAAQMALPEPPPPTTHWRVLRWGEWNEAGWTPATPLRVRGQAGTWRLMGPYHAGTEGVLLAKLDRWGRPSTTQYEAFYLSNVEREVAGPPPKAQPRASRANQPARGATSAPDTAPKRRR